MAEIPEPLKSVFEKIKERAFLVMCHWKIYTDIFRHSELRTELLNESAPEAFISIQIALETEIILALSRLTDERGKDNQQKLSLEKLHEEIKKSDEIALLRSLRTKLKDIKDKCEKIREYRNTYLAHLDFNTLMSRTPGPDSVTFNMIEEVIRAFNDYLSTFEQYYEPDTEFTYGVSFTTSGNALIEVLKYGLRLEELVEEGRIDHDEMRGGRWGEA
jgi:hypothetical protein